MSPFRLLIQPTLDGTRVTANGSASPPCVPGAR
jgi:hypothetical protein